MAKLLSEAPGCMGRQALVIQNYISQGEMNAEVMNVFSLLDTSKKRHFCWGGGSSM